MNVQSEDPEICQDDREEKTTEVNLQTAEDPEAETRGGRNWKISKCVDGKLTYFHIKPALIKNSFYLASISLGVAKGDTEHRSISKERDH